MASSDLRDVLNISNDAGHRPSKKQKLSAPRPNLKGLAREVQSLGGDNPIAIVPEVTQFKKRRLASRKPAARWELRQFRNSGRKDSSLLLRHWRRIEQKAAGDEVMSEENGEKKPEEIEDSLFAKFNVHVSVPQYSDDQYQQVLRNDDWTKDETDYLMSLARDFDLRWPLIWDRYEWAPEATNGEANADGDESKAVIPAVRNRSMEDLKARYYEVAAKMMAVQKPVQYMTQPEYALHEMMAHFNPQQEKARKDFAINSLARSPEEFREEEALLVEIKRIMARIDRFNEDRRDLYNRLDYPHADPQSQTDLNAFKSSAGLQNLLQTMMTADKTKKRKSLLAADGQSPAAPPAPQNAAPEAARRDSTAAAPAHRDSIASVATPTAGSKKGQQPVPERRKLTDQEEAIYGVTHFDRLSSGPVFRTEKINKLFSHKSNQQQMRITNTLNELDVPNRLAMPTGATTHQYELLLGAVNSLLDAKKVMDKVMAEIKVEEAKKAEREKALGITQPAAEKKETEEGDTSTAAADESAAPKESEAGASEDATETAADKEGEEKDDEEENGTAKVDDATAGEADKEADQEEAEDGDENAGDGEEANNADEEKEADDTEDKAAPEASAASHKRSASVLSSVSDKSSKRQKK